MLVEGSDEPFLAPADFVAPEVDASGVALLPLGDPCVDAREQLSLLGTPALAQAATLRHLGVGPVVLLDGAVVGAWSWDDTLSTRALVTLSERDTVRVAQAAARTRGFIAGELGGVVPLHGARAPRAAPLAHGDVSMER